MGPPLPFGICPLFTPDLFFSDPHGVDTFCHGQWLVWTVVNWLPSYKTKSRIDHGGVSQEIYISR